MTELFNNKYRIPSARLQHWNYANEGMYFITICTKNRKNYFGEIVSAETRCLASLQPTEIGQIAHSEWYKTIELRPDSNLELGEFVVMPNHIHGIIIIGKMNTTCIRIRIQTRCIASLPTKTNTKMNLPHNPKIWRQ